MTAHPLLIACAVVAVVLLLWMAALVTLVVLTDTVLWQALDILLSSAGA